MAKKNNNSLFLRAGRLTSGSRSPVGSIADVRKRIASAGQGRVEFPISRQRAANRRDGIDSFKQNVRGFWGKG
jgi:hypothetical protein